MFGKKQCKTIDMSTGELIAFKPVSLWTKAKMIEVDTTSGSCNHYENVEFRVTNETLIINDKGTQCTVYNLGHVIKYYFQPDISPHT